MKKVIRNSAWLSTAHLAGYLIPLLELPILTRALGPEVYGGVLFALASSLAFSLIVEFGFNLSASREIAAVRDDRLKVARIVGNVMLAKFMLAAFIVSFVALGIAVFGLPASLTENLLAPACLFFLAFGLSPFWYFQGTERMVGPVLLNLGLRVIGLGLLWFFVRSEDDGALALYLLAAVGFINTFITIVWMMWEVRSPTGSFHGAWRQLAGGWHAFVYRSSNDVLMSASPAVLGFASTRYETGVFVPAEKVIKACAGMVTPVLTAFFPFLSRRFNETGVSSGWGVVLVLSACSFIGAYLLFWLSPWLIKILAGDGFEKTTALLQWFVCLIPLRVINQSLGIAILMPAGRDRWAGYSLIVCAVIAMSLGFWLAGNYGAQGMVFGLLFGEALLCLLLFPVALRTSRVCT